MKNRIFSAYVKDVDYPSLTNEPTISKNSPRPSFSDFKTKIGFSSLVAACLLYSVVSCFVMCYFVTDCSVCYNNAIFVGYFIPSK